MIYVIDFIELTVTATSLIMVAASLIWFVYGLYVVTVDP